MTKVHKGFFDTDRATRSFLVVGYFNFALLLITAVAAIDETRTLNGINLWLKPLKFDFAMMVHSFTLAVLVQQLSPQARRGIVLGISTALYSFCAVFENVYITIQAMRGRHSHFNFETTFEAIMYAQMGLAALILVIVPMVIAILLWRNHTMPKTAYRLGTIVGLLIGPILTIAYGGYMSMSGSHFVGAPGVSDAGGLPLVGWSTTVPDLRPAHFFALHMIQLVPFIGWLGDKVSPSFARPLVWGVASITAGLSTWLFFNALAGNTLSSLGL